MQTTKANQHPALHEADLPRLPPNHFTSPTKRTHPSLLTWRAVLPSAGVMAELPISMATAWMREPPPPPPTPHPR